MVSISEGGRSCYVRNDESEHTYCSGNEHTHTIIGQEHYKRLIRGEEISLQEGGPLQNVSHL